MLLVPSNSSSTKSGSLIMMTTNNMVLPKCCVLDSKGCLSLSSILASFTAAINEEQAWALAYQTLRCAQVIVQDPSSRDSCYIACHSDHIKIHKDGYIHPDSYLDPEQQGLHRKTKCSSECKIISKLGKVIFEALDYGLSEEDERQLSPELDELLDTMISADDSTERPETDDEGIERDSGDSDDDRGESSHGDYIDTLLGLCRERLGGGSGNSDPHYKAVCRALVAEALELSEFLEKVSQGTQQLRRPEGHHTGRNSASPNSLQPDPDLDQLHFTVWARLWVQVIQDLRTGVKLKKVESHESGCCSHPIEYELTPYEILMDDIRSRRYKLKQVMVDGELPPRVKKDAHAIILEFIRSRPPLKKVTDRKLGPPPAKKYDPIEALMDSIRQQHNLRPTQTKVNTSVRKDSVRMRNTRRQSSFGEMSRSPSISEQQLQHSQRDSSSSHANTHKSLEPPQRRLIKPDFDLLYSLEKDDDSDEEMNNGKSNNTLYYGHICPDQTQSEPASPWKTNKPLVNGSKSGETGDNNSTFYLSAVNLRRRHTICNPTHNDDYNSTSITFPLEYSPNNLPPFHSLNSPSVSPVLHRRKTQLPRSMSKSLLQEELFQSNQWQTAMECLSLNLEEVVHIRNVLTKAELEGLPVDCNTKEDVQKGKVCFLCLKARFGLFLQRGNQCKLCTRMVCTKCCSKMRIPTDHFANIPVSTLSPLMSPRDEDYSLTPTKTSQRSSPVHGPNKRKNSVGSAPNSPTLSRSSLGVELESGQRSVSPSLMDTSEDRDRFSEESGPYSLPSVSSISSSLLALKRRGFIGSRKDSEKTERLRGALMVVCHDCKAMVLQIIRSSRASKQRQRSNNLTLEIPTNQHVSSQFHS